MSLIDDIRIGADGIARCRWCDVDDEYRRYHDEEWGRRPVHDDEWFEKVCLEGFQAGLSWITILRRRDRFREVFDGFDPSTVATFGERQVRAALRDAGIIRHEGKIRSTINNAARALDLKREFGSLGQFFIQFAEPEKSAPRRLADIPAKTETSLALSKALRSRGWTFVGPTTMYAMAQSMGLVNDHLVGCWRRESC